MSSNKRVSIPIPIKQILIDEVDDLCPICSDPLHEEKNGKYIVQFEVAHIYPLNPTENEKVILKNVEKLTSDINGIDNLIALCKKCHKRYDTDKTIKEYIELLEIKKVLINKRVSKTNFKNYTIEKEIHDILNILNSQEYIDKNDTKFTYEPKTIDNKLNSDFTLLVKKTIKANVSEYYSVIKSKLIDIENIEPTKSDSISMQIKLHYIALSRNKKSSQEEIINSLVLWLEKLTKKPSIACHITISFFIQNCEVF
ncbi:MAG: HNH endonuclease [Campylobacterales bacterium]|nr:HNH endonuclease [Campylobacterales bacterium]